MVLIDYFNLLQNLHELIIKQRYQSRQQILRAIMIISKIFKKSFKNINLQYLRINAFEFTINKNEDIKTNIFNIINEKNRILIKKSLTMKLLFNFSNSKQTVRPPQSISTHAQKILTYLNTFKDQQIAAKNIQLVSQQILSSPLTKSQKSSIVKYLMSILFKKNYPVSQLLSNQLYIKLIKDQPFLQLQTYLYVITKQRTKPTPNLNLINDLYLQCFDKILVKAPQNQKAKCQAVLYKNFGKYMIESGMKQKGVIALQKSIVRHKELILSQYHKVQKSINKQSQSQQIRQKTKAQKQRQQLQINAIKQNIRRLLQSMFEILYYYYHEKRQIIRDPKISSKQKQQNIVTICTIINQCMKLKSVVPGVQLYSRYYHRLMQVYYQLEYAYGLINKNQKKVIETRKLMKEFQNQCLDDLMRAKEHLEVQKQIALAIFSIQLHLSKIQRKNDIQAIKRDLSELGIKVMDVGKMEQKSAAREVTIKLLADFIKKNLPPK